MTTESYIDEIKTKLTGGVLDLELTDEQLQKLLNSAFREMQRYITETRIVTIPYEKSCINLKQFNVNSVAAVYRSEGYMMSDSIDGTSQIDPMYMAGWQTISGSGLLYNMNNVTYNLGAWNTALQIRNTLSTDLAFQYDRASQNLYVNVAFDNPKFITIEYIPRFNSVEDITSDYWIDMLCRLSTALTKVTLGRVRSKYTQSNALWTLDGATLLEEGNTELGELREHLVANTQLNYPVD